MAYYSLWYVLAIGASQIIALIQLLVADNLGLWAFHCVSHFLFSFICYHLPDPCSILNGTWLREWVLFSISVHQRVVKICLHFRTISLLVTRSLLLTYPYHLQHAILAVIRVKLAIPVVRQLPSTSTLKEC